MIQIQNTGTDNNRLVRLVMELFLTPTAKLHLGAQLQKGVVSEVYLNLQELFHPSLNATTKPLYETPLLAHFFQSDLMIKLVEHMFQL